MMTWPALWHRRSVSAYWNNDPFALDAMCAMISAASKDFHVMWGTGSPAVAVEHCHNPHTRPDVPVSDPEESVGVAAAHCYSH